MDSRVPIREEPRNAPGAQFVVVERAVHTDRDQNAHVHLIQFAGAYRRVATPAPVPDRRSVLFIPYRHRRPRQRSMPVTTPLPDRQDGWPNGPGPTPTPQTTVSSTQPDVWRDESPERPTRTDRRSPGRQVREMTGHTTSDMGGVRANSPQWRASERTRSTVRRPSHRLSMRERPSTRDPSFRGRTGRRHSLSPPVSGYGRPSVKSNSVQTASRSVSTSS